MREVAWRSLQEDANAAVAPKTIWRSRGIASLGRMAQSGLSPRPHWVERFLAGAGAAVRSSCWRARSRDAHDAASKHCSLGPLPMGTTPAFLLAGTTLQSQARQL